MVRYTNIFACFLFLLVLVSCTKIDHNKHVGNLSNVHPLVKKIDWEVKRISGDVETYFQLESLVNDTLYTFNFWYDKKHQLYTTEELIIKCINEENLYLLHLSEEDTLIHFRSKTVIKSLSEIGILELNDIEFYQGKYYYQYLMGYLNSGQRLFFETNRDSLIKIKGNNLPSLPKKLK